MNNKMQDRHDVIVAFVKEVEKYPCIYNHTLPEYSNRVETKRAWEEIAKTLQCKESDCREKWRKIRIAFSRSLKQMKSGSSGIRPYYLYDHLTFVLPFCKINDDQAIQPTSPGTSEDDHEEELYLKPELSYSEDLRMTEPTEHINIAPVTAPKIRVVDKYQMSIEHDQKNDNSAIKRRRTENIEDNPRKMFLLSILPDIEALTDDEMRVFRRKLVTCIDTIMEGRVKKEYHYYD